MAKAVRGRDGRFQKKRRAAPKRKTTPRRNAPAARRAAPRRRATTAAAAPAKRRRAPSKAARRPRRTYRRNPEILGIEIPALDKIGFTAVGFVVPPIVEDFAVTQFPQIGGNMIARYAVRLVAIGVTAQAAKMAFGREAMRYVVIGGLAYVAGSVARDFLPGLQGLGYYSSGRVLPRKAGVGRYLEAPANMGMGRYIKRDMGNIRAEGAVIPRNQRVRGFNSLGRHMGMGPTRPGRG